MTDIILSTQNGEPVVSSRQIAESFEKRHDHVMRDIEDILKGLPKNGDTPMFYKTEYVHEQNGQTYPMYLMNRDGFTLLAMGFTGKAALEWKLKYIAAFNAMEKKLKENSPDYSELSPTLRYLIEMEQRQHQQEQALAQTNQRVDEIRELVALNPNGWRKTTTRMIVKIAQKMGGNQHIGDVYREAYDLMEERGHYRLSIRTENIRAEMRRGNTSKSRIEKVSQLDAIAADPRAIELWTKIIAEMAVKYGIAAPAKE